ncbi:type II toxin-antitoxin system RelE/ParE family toxin [Corynebacterium aquatimens]|uniref:Toxin n=1 Tax=Corynebacterium aquatimens TaxID=1190508 RepID=A0A931E0V5_9CORY|nr:toxin ParE1/3/4 [Corynebacterium aquatimens]WJY65654.1 Toxin ParE1 [Corynebacterium aquatimens]
MYNFTPRAKKDLNNIWEYTEQHWGTSQARKYLNNLHSACVVIAKNPEIGRLRPEIAEGLRSFRVEKHVLYYLEAEQGLSVVRVLHERMDISNIY